MNDDELEILVVIFVSKVVVCEVVVDNNGSSVVVKLSFLTKFNAA